MQLSKAQMAGIVTLTMILSGAIVADNISDSYYCAPEDNVKECLKVSSSGATCYYLGADSLTKGDRCVGGTWEALEMILAKNKEHTESIKVSANSKEWACELNNGAVTSYTKCSSGPATGYLGELI